MESAGELRPEVAVLLALLGPREAQPEQVGEMVWHALDAIAGEHRLRPHLHARRQRSELRPDVPPGIAASWATEHRVAGLIALSQRRDLVELTGLLSSAGIACIALKGSWLAWHAYPVPAARPLRDLDLLVEEEDGPRAWQILPDHGLALPDAAPADPALHAREQKQYPPLRTPAGTWVELHTHLWEPPGSMEWPTPPLRDAALLARAAPADDVAGLRYLEPTDMLAHLAVHAAYSHRFEVGPLLLADIALLAARERVEWPRLWREASAGGYLRGTALVVAMADRWSSPGLLTESGCPLAVSETAVLDAAALLCQPLAARQSTRSFAAMREARRRDGLLGAGIAATKRAARLAVDPARLIRRVGESLAAVGEPEVAESARRSAAIGAWLAEPQ